MLFKRVYKICCCVFLVLVAGLCACKKNSGGQGLPPAQSVGLKSVAPFPMGAAVGTGKACKAIPITWAPC